tara:strand:- start:243 stop:602 length:360 start_codon:yes stop_codon:yes gene_type:complete
MCWLLAYLDVFAGIAGLLGSTVLAIPLIEELRDRRHWDILDSIEQDERARRADAGGVPGITENEAIQLRMQMIYDRLGGAARQRAIALIGCGLLFLAFLLVIAGAGGPDGPWLYRQVCG